MTSLHAMQDQAYWKLLELLELCATSGMAAVDLLLFGLTTRALETVDAFAVLLQRWNVTAAANEVRIQLDNLLRLTLLWHIDAGSDAFAALRDGHPLNKVSDPTKPGTKAKLTDQRLRELASPEYPWIDHYYEEASRWIHYSGRHLGVALQFGELADDGSVPFSGYLPPRPDSYDADSLGDMLDAFINVTTAFAERLGVWVEGKRIHSEGSRP